MARDSAMMQETQNFAELEEKRAPERHPLFARTCFYATARCCASVLSSCSKA